MVLADLLTTSSLLYALHSLTITPLYIHTQHKQYWGKDVVKLFSPIPFSLRRNTQLFTTKGAAAVRSSVFCLRRLACSYNPPT